MVGGWSADNESISINGSSVLEYRNFNQIFNIPRGTSVTYMGTYATGTKFNLGIFKGQVLHVGTSELVQGPWM